MTKAKLMTVYALGAGVSLVLCVVLIRLGWWQLERAADKAVIIAEYERRVAEPPLSVSLAELSGLPSYQRVRVSGVFDPQKHVLVEQQYVNTREGARVLSLLHNGQAAEQQRGVYVLRGWVPKAGRQNFEGDVSQLPEAIDRQVFMVLRFDQLFRPSFSDEADNESLSETWPQFVLSLDYTKLENSISFDLQNVVLKPLTKDDWVFYDDWQPVSLGVYRHYGYAAQWFLLALTFLLLFGFLIYRARNAQSND